MKNVKTDIFSIKKKQKIVSKFLNRVVIYDLIIPNLNNSKACYPVIYMNDGQDFDQLDLEKIEKGFYENYTSPHIFVAIHCNNERILEYGTSFVADYKKRGIKATDYMNFVVKELMPFIQFTYSGSNLATDNTICGFSLGGLSAFDIAFENSNLFSKIGVFSGSFWWRDKSYEEGFDEDADRIMHKKIKNFGKNTDQQFWLECGTLDETADRNNNGIIDSIDDTLDIIKELKNAGFEPNSITYVEIVGGEHNFETWKKVFPDFLKWVFNK